MAFELVREGLQRHPGDQVLLYLCALALARGGLRLRTPAAHEARRRQERRAVKPALGESKRVRLAAMRDRGAPGELLGRVTLDELVEAHQPDVAVLESLFYGVNARSLIVLAQARGALVATLATNLLAGLVPIPGGIGVAEAVLTSFLIVLGLSPEAAFAAAVIFRIATFYIPAGEGFFAMKWLEKNGHL